MRVVIFKKNGVQAMIEYPFSNENYVYILFYLFLWCT